MGLGIGLPAHDRHDEKRRSLANRRSFEPGGALPPGFFIDFYYRGSKVMSFNRGIPL